MRIESPDDFRSPRLPEFLGPKFYDLDEGDQKPIMRRAHLRAAGLPDDYDDLTEEGQKGARWAVLSSWYDLDRPQVACTDIDKFVTAMYLWVEEYVKPATHNRAVYFNRDPKHKYDMIREGFAPTKVAGECAKNMLTAPRMSTKTDTFIHQACTMLGCCRPFTKILISEINGPITNSQLQIIRGEIEQNEYIHRDFGGAGQLYPRSNRGKEKWGYDQLDFLHATGTSIQGTSFYSSIRGKHPLVWLIDDPESDGNVREKGHKNEFVDNLFPRGLGMMTGGNVVILLQTRILGGVIDVAMRTAAREDNEDDAELRELMGRNKWSDWNRVNYDLLVEKEDGTVESIYPDHVSVEGFEAKKASLGVRAALAEYRGIAIPEGSLVFERDQHRHGYMRCTRNVEIPGQAEDYMFDLRTGVSMPWDKFISSLTIMGGCDLADSTTERSDFPCCILVGVDPYGIHYVLDCFMKRVLSEEMIQYAFALAESFPVEAMGWEKGTFQNVVVRMADRYGRQLEQAGKVPPMVVPISNTGQQKTARIVATLRGPFENDQIRFPSFDPVRDVNGDIHEPVRTTSRLSFLALYEQLDTFTDDGAADHDDGPDALQMAFRMLAGRRGPTPAVEDPNWHTAQRFLDIGVKLNPSRMPDDLRKKLDDETDVEYDDYYTEMDPYAHT